MPTGLVKVRQHQLIPAALHFCELEQTCCTSSIVPIRVCAAAIAGAGDVDCAG